ncbi:MAG: hypothetical protein ACOYT8_01100 [Candidatus Dependentiae bacterium]
MKFITYFFSFLMAINAIISLQAMAPAQLSSLQQEFKTVLRAQNFDRAQEIVSTLENAGARAIALPLKAELEAALKEYAIAFGADISTQFARVKQDLLAQQDQNRKNTVLIEQLRKELKAAHSEGADLQNQFNRIEKEYNDAIKSRTKIETDLRNLNINLQNQANNYLRQINQIQQEAADRENRIAQELRDARTEFNTLRIERDQAQQQLSQALQVNKTTRSEFETNFNQLREQLQKDYDARIKQLQQTIEVANNTINNLQDQLRNKSADTALKNENIRLATENRGFQQRIAQLEQDLAKALADSLAKDQQLVTLKTQEEAQRKKVEGELGAAQIQIQQLQKDIIELNNLVAARDQQINQLNKDLKAQFDLVEQAQDNARVRIEQKDKQLNEARAQIAQLNQQLQQAAQGQPADLVAQNALLSEQIISLQAQLKYKEDFLSSAREYADLMQRQKRDATFKLIDVQRERDTAQKQLEQARKNAQENATRLEREKQQLEQQVRQVNAELQQRLAQAEETFNKTLQDAIAQKDEEIKKLQDRILEYADKIKDLTLQLEQAPKAPIAQPSEQVIQLQQQINTIETALNNVLIFFQQRFLPSISGMLPTITPQDTAEMQNKLDAIIKLIKGSNKK